MAKKKNLTVRVDEAWQDTLDQVIRIVEPNEKPDRSRLIRVLGDREATLWLKSPYVASKAQHFVYVTKQGDVYYQGIQELQLKTKRDRLPSSIGMKPEQRSFFAGQSEAGPCLVEAIRSRWLINHFSVWDGRSSSSQPLVSAVDRNGITGKFADLEISRDKDRTVTREILAGFRDYVQHSEQGDTSDDRGGMPIDFPTLNFEIQIVVDAELYGYDDPALAVGYEIRNRESARFHEEGLNTSENPLQWSNGRYPDPFPSGTYRATLERIQESFAKFRHRLHELSGPSRLAGDGKPIVASEEARQAIQEVEMLPDKFLFGRFYWKMPFPGLEICASWNKPRFKPD